MLFTSYEFLLLFLPATIAGFFCVARFSHRFAASWLAGASLFFYGWWNPKLVVLLLASIAFNFAAGRMLARRPARGLLAIAVATNLAVLAFFKYTNFFISTANELASTGLPLLEIVLPLGISFFTFTQIAFLVDVYQGKAKEYDPVHYALFVSYFPHLIAGPVLHHRQMMPQFAQPETFRPSAENIATGLMIFIIGFAKKVLLADSFAEYSTPIFDGARDGADVGFFAAWTGALGYTFQLYFDFSGYSDMAVGLSRLFGISIPMNFHSPYKSANIIEFWKRWHMTLSQFLRDYLYIPLGGNRKGTARRYVNLMATMLLGGLWHGAGWTFVAWGGLHGIFLVINHAWRAMRKEKPSKGGAFGRLTGTTLTFLCVVVGWVFFRAETFDTALRMLAAMCALPIAIPDVEQAYSGFAVPPDSWSRILALFAVGIVVVFGMPNTQTIVARWSPAAGFRYVAIGASAFLAVTLAAINGSRGTSEFIYFNF